MMEEKKTTKESGSIVENENLKPDTKGKILLIDADTIVYATCSVCEYLEDESSDEYNINLPQALEIAQEKVSELLALTGCESAVLHFTSGKNFRYTIKADYKMNRSDTRYPVGLRELKSMMVPLYPNSKVSSEVEADDLVCMLKREGPDKYIVCAVDKDVLNGVPGTHFNYFKRAKTTNKWGTELAQINMKWLETSDKVAMAWPYMQTMMGDGADGISGVPGCGPAKTMDLLFPDLSIKIKSLKQDYKLKHGKAVPSDKLISLIVMENKLLDTVTPNESNMWDVVVSAYVSKGMTEIDAIQTMRLVHMHQLTKDEELVLWTQPN